MASEPRVRLQFALALAIAAMLSGCATVRLHGADELSSVERSCGLAQGEVIQEAEEPKVLILYAIAPSRTQIACVARWSRKNHLHLAYIQAVDWQDH
jgi:ABC-type uncharacterized transport system auxiliary subunit